MEVLKPGLYIATQNWESCARLWHFADDEMILLGEKRPEMIDDEPKHPLSIRDLQIFNNSLHILDHVGLYAGIDDYFQDNIKLKKSMDCFTSHEGRLFGAIDNAVVDIEQPQKLAQRESYFNIQRLISHHGVLYDCGFIGDDIGRIHKTLEDLDGSSPIAVRNGRVIDMFSHNGVLYDMIQSLETFTVAYDDILPSLDMPESVREGAKQRFGGQRHSSNMWFSHMFHTNDDPDGRFPGKQLCHMSGAASFQGDLFAYHNIVVEDAMYPSLVNMTQDRREHKFYELITAMTAYEPE